MRFTAMAVVCGFLCNSFATGAVEYTAVNIRGGLSGDVRGYGINASGHVAGDFDSGGTMGFYYNGTTSVAIGFSNNARAINDQDQVVGPGYVYQNGVRTPIPGADIFDINNSGQMSGTFRSSGDAFFYDGSTFHDLGAGTGFGINRLNDSAHLVGNASNGAAFIYFNGSTIETVSNFFAWGINNLNQVIGTSSADGRGHIYDIGAAGFTTDLGPMDSNNPPEAINDLGKIVGRMHNHAVVYSGGTWTDLNTLVAPMPGVTFFDATDINNSGQIIAHATSPSGNYDTYILTPIPEPGGLALLSLALPVLWKRKRGEVEVHLLDSEAGAEGTARGSQF